MSNIITKFTKVIGGVAGVLAIALMLGGVVVAPSSAQAITQAEATAIITALGLTGSQAAVIQALVTGGSTGSTGGTGYVFSQTLRQGSTGNEVRELQKALNSLACCKVAASGAGSPGMESTYFGPATRAAVVKFQNAYASDILTPIGLTSGTGLFGPASIAKMNSLMASSGGNTGGGTTVPTTGTVSVSLAASSPAQGAVIQGQAQANLAHYTFTNGTGSAVNVTKVTLNRIGISSDSTLSNVYLFNGAVRVTDAATVSSGVISFNNTAGIFSIPANSSVTISVQADIAGSTAGQIVGVALASVETNPAATVSGAFPIAANVQSVAAATMGTVAFTYNGPTGGSENPANEVRVFEAQAVVSTHKARLESIAFENRGTTKDGDLTNLKLFVDGVQVGTVAGFVNDRATFDLRNTPITLETGTRNIRVLADIVNGSSFTYNIQIRRASDVRVIDVELGQPILVTDSDASFPVSPAAATTVSGGSLSITRAATSPTTNIPVGSSNVLIGSFEFRAAGENVKIEAITVDADTSASVGGLDNGKVFVNGAQVGSTSDIAEGGTTEFSFGSSFIALAGATTKVDIYADAKTSTGANLINGETVDVGVSVAAADTEGMSSGNTVSAISEVESFSRTVSSSSLTATKASGYGNQTMIAGTQNAKIGSFTLSAGSTEGININSIVIELAGDNASSITDLRLMDGATQIGTTKPSPSSSNTFSTNFVLAASASKTIDVYANIKTGLPSGTIVATVDTSTGGTGAITGTSATAGSDVALQTITIGSGALTVAVNNGSTPNSYIAIAGTNKVKVGTFRFTAQYADYTVDEVMIKVPSDAATSVSGVTLEWSGGSVSGNALSLPTGSAANQVAAYATSTFTGMQMSVPMNTSRDLDVYVNIPTIASGAATGKAITVLIDADNGFKATPLGGTATTTLQTSSDLDSSATSGKGTVIVRKSKPTLSAVALDNTTLSAGSNQVLARVRVAADSAGDVGWKKLSFTVNKTAAITLGATSTIALWEGSNQVAGVFGTTTGSTLVGGLDSLVNLTSGNLTFVATSEQEIAAGTSKVYELRGTVGGLASGSNNVSVSIANPSTSVTTGTATGVAADTVASTPSFGWTDRSSITAVHSESTSDWTNDYLVRELPLTVGTRTLNF